MAGMKYKLFLALMLVLTAAAPLTGCGKKPSFVDAPEGQEGPFPRTYPYPAPAPGSDE